jgi:hypothetical protein
VRSSASKAPGILRLLKFQLLGQWKAWRAPSERRKIAIYSSRRIAAYHFILHFVPLSGAITLLGLNWASFFVGATFPNATSLQFAAKLHELLMQSSIAEVTLTIIRTQAVEGDIPVGALSASMQTLQPSYLWSLDFVSAITSRALVGWRKTVFIAFVPLLISLTALVGPTSAILMIPRSGTSHVEFRMQTLLDISVTSLFPTFVSNAQNLSL